LRVTIQQSGFERITMKIEGRVAGVQVPELQQAWRDLAPSLGQRGLLVDLRGVTHMDEAGRKVLADIYEMTRAKFLADTPLTKYFAEDAQNGIRTRSESID
jgi:anti-anti-sigma regulatory factor